jgi:hypothetical protein
MRNRDVQRTRVSREVAAQALFRRCNTVKYPTRNW